jgi:hypothetical protein
MSMDDDDVDDTAHDGRITDIESMGWVVTGIKSRMDRAEN